MEKLRDQKKNRIRNIPCSEMDSKPIENEQMCDFPKSKYFQVHFQHCHQNAEIIHQELDVLIEAVETLQKKLERIMIILEQQS